MSLRPLDLAQNIGNMAQQAQQKLGEAAADRASASRDAEHEQAEALKQLQQVAKERETQGHRVGDEEGAPRERPHHEAGREAGEDASEEHPHVGPHTDETPEGKGRALDIDV